MEGKLLCGQLEKFGFEMIHYQFMSSQNMEYQLHAATDWLAIYINIEGVALIHGGSQSRVISPEKNFQFTSFSPQKLKLRQLPGRHEYISVLFSRAWLEMVMGPLTQEQMNLLIEPQEFPWNAATRELVNVCRSFNGSQSKVHLPALAHQILGRAMDRNASERVAVTENTQPHRLQRIEWVKRYLQNHLTVPLSLTELSSRTGCTPSHLSRTFTEHEGITLSQYLRKIRLETARRHLSENHLSITEVALESGYQSLSHFSHLFRQQYKCTPQAYRQRFR
ncbi:MAG: AraC family transcriptional regulator [Verrucomicrobiota bacterium]